MDKFYTSEEVVISSLATLRRLVDISPEDLIIEPSAGDGSFMKKLDHEHVIGIDIYPEADHIVECDFFLYEIPKGYDKIHVVGNPPFGKNGSMAMKFLKRSMEFAESVSFILPRSFKKESFLMKIPSHFEMIHQEDVPKNSFLVEGERYNVPCVFQIWKRNVDNVRRFEKVSPVGYSFVKKEDEHDVAFRRVGGKSGEIKIDTKDCNVNCYYFIRFDSGVSVDIERLQNVTFEERDDTAGPRSISKRELIKKYNPIIAGEPHASVCKM